MPRFDPLVEVGPQGRVRPKRIGVIVDPVYAHGRGILRGIMTYGLGCGWQFQKPSGWFFEAMPDMRNWNVDGLIASVHDESMASFVQQMGVPTVNISSSYAYGDWPSAVCDNRMIGRLAAMHFRDRGVRSLAYVGLRTAKWSLERQEGFTGVATDHGMTCAICPHDVYNLAERGETGSATPIQRWLSSLPKSTGVFAGNDSIAEIVMSDAREAGRHVPEDLAVLGCDNDDMTVMMTTPSLSSVDTNAGLVGHEAARLLANLIAGGAPPTEPVRVPPVGVVARASSDVLALPDVDVVTAVRFIREHAALEVNVDDVLAVVPLSRRPLEKRFHRVLGRSILAEIHRVHVERAAQLLVSTDLPMPAIARASGFATYTRLGIVFRKINGCSPTAYRQRFRPGQSGVGADTDV